MKRDKKHKLRIETYDCFINLVLTEDIQRAAKRLYKRFSWEIPKDLDAQGWFFSHEGSYYIILGHTCTVKSLVHEALHSSIHILFDRDVKTTVHNHEALTYLTDSIVGQIAQKVQVTIEF